MNNYKKAIEFVIENKTDWKRTCINLIQNHPSVFMKVAVVEGNEENVVEEKKVEGLTKDQFRTVLNYLKCGMDFHANVSYIAVTSCGPNHSKQICDAIKAGLLVWED